MEVVGLILMEKGGRYANVHQTITSCHIQLLYPCHRLTLIYWYQQVNRNGICFCRGSIVDFGQARGYCIVRRAGTGYHVITLYA